MCGITGWVDYRRELAGDDGAAATLRDMTATMACRGPDAEGMHLDGPAGLWSPSRTAARCTTSASCGPSSPGAATSSAPAATPRSCCTPTWSGARASSTT